MIETAPVETRRGAKGKYNPERVERILTYLREGNTRKAAGAASGISQDTFCEWLNRYPEFSEQVTRAEGEAETKAVQTILSAAIKGQWGAAAFWLERRRHEDWGKKDRIQLVNDVRELARTHQIDEDDAVKAADQYLKELRSAKRA